MRDPEEEWMNFFILTFWWDVSHKWFHSVQPQSWFLHRSMIHQPQMSAISMNFQYDLKPIDLLPAEQAAWTRYWSDGHHIDHLVKNLEMAADEVKSPHKLMFFG